MVVTVAPGTSAPTAAWSRRLTVAVTVAIARKLLTSLPLVPGTIQVAARERVVIEASPRRSRRRPRWPGRRCPHFHPPDADLDRRRGQFRARLLRRFDPGCQPRARERRLRTGHH